jgi:hypothetical protein
MLRVIKSCLKDVAGKTRAETAVLYALFNGTLGNRASTPEHVALAQLTSWAIGFFPPCTSPAESTTSPNKVSIHLEILFCVCIPLQRPNGWHQRRRAAPSAACVTANGKIPKRAKIKLPTFVKWFHLRHNGLVSRRAEEEATHAESGGTIHDQRSAP